MDKHLRTSWRCAVCLGTGLWAVAACTPGGDGSAVQRTDSAGVEIVVSGATDRPLDWQFRLLFTLGGADEGPEAFFRVAPGLVGSDASGNLYVLDAPNARVVVFDTTGAFVRSMGSSGSGPGEFRMPASLSVSSDGFVTVFDFARGSLVRFAADGAVDGERLLPLFPAPNDQRHFAQSADTILVSTSMTTPDGSGLRQLLRRIVGVDTLVLLDVPLPAPEMALYERCGGGMRQPPVFASEIAWAAQPGRVAVASTADYAVSLWEGGRVARSVRRAIAPQPATREEAIRHLGEGFRINFGRGPCLIDPAEMVEKRGHADVVPPIRTVLLSPSGELWVQRFTVDPTAVIPIDVFDARGAYVGTIVREFFLPVILLPDGRVGAVETDALDVARLAIYAMQR